MIFIITLHPRNADHLHQNKITIPIGVSFFQDASLFNILRGYHKKNCFLPRYYQCWVVLLVFLRTT